MTALEIVFGSILLLVSLILVVIVLMQEGRQAGLSGAIAGGAETFFGKNKGRTIEDKLVKITKVTAGIFFALTLTTTLLFLFF